MKKLSKEELIKLVRDIYEVNFDNEENYDKAILKFRENVPHPEAADLIFYHNPELSPEEVVEKALSYKPIILPPPEEYQSH